MNAASRARQDIDQGSIVGHDVKVGGDDTPVNHYRHIK
jgi:hypothetical protein